MEIYEQDVMPKQTLRIRCRQHRDGRGKVMDTLRVEQNVSLGEGMIKLNRRIAIDDHAEELGIGNVVTRSSTTLLNTANCQTNGCPLTTDIEPHVKTHGTQLGVFHTITSGSR